MTLSSVASCLCLAAASLSAQNYLLLPATTAPSADLPSYDSMGLPFMAPDARVQMFFDETEVGSSTFVADQLSLRYDGPIPAVGAPGPFLIQRLRIRIGTTTVPMPGADFAANLTQPLTSVFDSAWSFVPDPGFGSPHGWGEPNGSLTFTFSTPAPITIPAGGWLVVDLQVEGNNIWNFGYAHAILDGATTTGGIQNGSATTFGQGCSAGPGLPAASISTSGTYAPGAVHFVNGQHLGANAVAVAVFGLSNSDWAGTPLPLLLPGTGCTIYTDPVVMSPVITDATGAVTDNPATALAMPVDPSAAGLVVYEQMVSLVDTANPWGLVFSNAATVTYGYFNPLGRGTYSVANDSSATAAHANVVRPFGYAMRLRTL